ncbi:MAG: hypothetical protein M3485_08345 [Pseudomonadota bacterium]|nr:hypothetical protein [Pseudomonadota bacterium]
MSRRLAACLLLFCACLPAAAREVRLSGANSDGGSCPDQIAAVVEEAQAVRGSKTALPATAPEKAASARGAEAQNAVRPPRWHSFLPGMFR